jgi:hypothetical protein
MSSLIPRVEREKRERNEARGGDGRDGSGLEFRQHCHSRQKRRLGINSPQKLFFLYVDLPHPLTYLSHTLFL